MIAPGMLALVAACLACMGYVYRGRGRIRYASLTQYVRKSWPIFAPLNCVLYAYTHAAARVPFPPLTLWPQLHALETHWEVIRDEALALHAEGRFEAGTDPSSPGFHDVGFRTFYRHGWSKFYLKWYGYCHPSARRLCPRTGALLDSIPGIHAAMFSMLPPGAQLTAHADPMACAFRYHLGLATPGSPHCHIEVDGERRSWRDGVGFVFDETYLHHACNDTNQPRLILMCDIERPMHLPGRLFNRLYMCLAGAMLVRNTDEDRRGLASLSFATVAPLLALGKRLRARHRPAYRVLKFLVNTAIAVVLLGAGALTLQLAVAALKMLGVLWA